MFLGYLRCWSHGREFSDKRVGPFNPTERPLAKGCKEYSIIRMDGVFQQHPNSENYVRFVNFTVNVSSL